MLDMGGYGPGAYFILNAARRKRPRLAEWALTHGAGPDARTSSHPKFKPRLTLYEQATLERRTEMADLLARYGAARSVPVLSAEEAFVAACLRMDREAVRSQLEAHPEYLQSETAIFRSGAARSRRRRRVPARSGRAARNRKLRASSGCCTRPRGTTPSASRSCSSSAVRRSIRSRPTGARTPIGWAAYGDRMEMIDFLSRFTEGRLDARVQGLRRSAARSPGGGAGARTGRRQRRHHAALVAARRRGEGAGDRRIVHGARRRSVAQIKRAGPPPTGHASAACSRSRGFSPWTRRLTCPRPHYPLRSISTRASRRPSSSLSKRDMPTRCGVFRNTRGPRSRGTSSARVCASNSARWIERPEGYFALPHARLLIARQAGFENWAALAKAFA